MPSHRWILALALMPLVSVAATCSGRAPIDLDVRDRDRLTPGGRVSYEIAPGNSQRRDGSLLDLLRKRPADDPAEAFGPEQAQVQPTIRIEGALAYVEASDREQVPAGRQAELDVTIPGPALVELDVENLRGHVAVASGVRFLDAISLEAIIGVGLDSTEVRIRSAGLEGNDQDTTAGFLSGGRVMVRPIALFDLYAQGTLTLISEDKWSSEAEVGVDLNLTRNVSIFSGYRWWNFYEDDKASGSDVHIKVRGPTVGMSLKF